jgi:hypothetical protein
MARAFIRFKNGTHKTIPYEKGLAIHYVLTGERKPENQAQADYAARVARVFISHTSAPESYIAAHKVVLQNLEDYHNRPAPGQQVKPNVYDERYK